MKRALTAHEDTNMYGGAHITNISTARKAAQEGRDLIIHYASYDGQRYHYGTYRVTDLRETPDGNVVGTDDYGDPWTAAAELCDFAKTGRI